MSANIHHSESVQKVATLLLYLEMLRPSVTKTLFKTLGEDKSRQILSVMSNLGKVESNAVRTVVSEFFTFLVEKRTIYGGRNITSKIFENVYGVCLETTGTHYSKPFQFLDTVDDEKLIQFLKKTSLQLKALVLTYVTRERAALLVAKMDDQTAMKLLNLVLKVENPSSPLLKKIESKMMKELMKDDQPVDNEQVMKISSVLEQTPSSRRNILLGSLENDNPDVVELVKANIITRDSKACFRLYKRKFFTSRYSSSGRRS